MLVQWRLFRSVGTGTILVGHGMFWTEFRTRVFRWNWVRSLMKMVSLVSLRRLLQWWLDIFPCYWTGELALCGCRKVVFCCCCWVCCWHIDCRLFPMSYTSAPDVSLGLQITGHFSQSFRFVGSVWLPMMFHLCMCVSLALKFGDFTSLGSLSYSEVFWFACKVRPITGKWLICHLVQ